MTQQTIKATSDPVAAQKLVDQYLSGEAPSDTPEYGVAFTDLPDTIVSLPGGYLTEDGSLVREVEVRELNGFDEEALARATTPGKVIQTLLSRAVVRVGDSKPTQDILDSLLSGDRDSLLLAIRRVTWGDEVKYGFECRNCGAVNEALINLATDVEVRTLEEAGDRFFDVELRRGGVAKVQLPDGEVARKIVAAKTSAEMATILLRCTVTEIKGMPVYGDDQVRGLSMPDREKILQEITDRNPGPQLNSVKKACTACSEEIVLPLDLTELFRS